MKRKNLFKIISAMLICILLFNSYDASATIFAESEEWNYAEFYRIKGWGNIELKEQIDMLDVPKEYIIGADAEQLIKYVVNYPLLIDAYVYDNPEQGVEHIRNTCSALDELLKRDDALELINKALEDVSRYIDEDNIQGELAESVAEGFLKLLLQTEFGIKSQNSSFVNSGVEYSVTRNITSSISITTTYFKGLYTLNNVSFNCLYFKTGELTAAQKQQVDTAFGNAHPDWTKLQSASTRYNCHSYALISTSNSNVYWLSCPAAIYNSSMYTQLSANPSSAQPGDKVLLRGSSYSYDEFNNYHNILHSANIISTGSLTAAIQTESKLGPAGTYRTSLANIIELYEADSYEIYRHN